jgi:hypothetical protein
MRRWLRRTVLIAAAVLVAGEVLYLLVANFYVNSGRPSALASRNPGKFSIRWGKAWTLWPGRICLRDIELGGRSSRIDWYARLDSADASFDIAPLFSGTIHLRHVSASGIDYRQRRRLEAGESAPAGESEMPPLPAFKVPHLPPRPPAPEEARRAPWIIVADRIDAEVRQLWFDRYRLSGPMQVATSMRLIPRGPMEFPWVRIGMARGALAQGERAILGGLRLDIETALPPFVPRGMKAIELLRMLTGRFQVQSERASLFFLEAYFKKAPWLHFNGSSALKADLRIEGGRLQPGSTLTSTSEAVDIDFLDRKLTGRGRTSLRVEESAGRAESHAEVLLDEFALSIPGEAGPYARGRGFKLTATSQALDLSDPFATLEVTVDLPNAEIPDLSFFNRFIPAGSGIVIRGGKGTLQYHVEGSQREESVHGWIELFADDMVTKFENYVIRNDIKIHTVLKDVHPRTGLFDISGTRIDLKSNKFPWTADISFPKAQVRYSTPLEGSMVAAFRMTDTTPLVAMFDAQKEISGFARRLMTIRDIRGKSALAVNRGGCEITGLEITGEKFLALADLALRPGGRDGILYLRLHIFSVGVAFEKGKKNLDMVRARKWFERERAKRHGKPAPR